MKISSIYDAEFAPYGKIMEGYDVQPILDVLNSSTPLPDGIVYKPEEAAIQSLPAAKELGISLYGGLPVQFGYCNGHNTKLNCLEYHRDSEFNLGTEDFILILAKEGEVVDGKLDTSLCKAFRVPAGVLVEVYATSLHYAPCHTDPAKGFRVLVALPKGTNYEMPRTGGRAFEDKLLRASNKWLLAHPDTQEARDGAHIGLVGKNLDIAENI